MNPLRTVSRFASGLASVATGLTALGATVRGERLVTVSTTAGEISPGAVIFATGTPPRLDGLTIDVPYGNLKGHILTSEPAPIRLGGGFAPIATQIEEDRLLAGGTVDEGDDTPDIHPEIVAGIVADLERAFPALKGLAVSHAWVTSGHFRHGILLAPATGRALASWVASGEQPPDVVGMEIGRFTSPTHAGC
jgi:glycine/D-amino acid oxidase-like deaminating enzyme